MADNNDHRKQETEGMSLGKARSLLLERHNMVVDENDPIMGLVTLHHGFVADYESMLARHNLALTRTIGEALRGLTEEALGKNLHDHTVLADRTGQIFETQYRRAKLLSLANVVAAFISLPTLVYLIIK